MGVEGQELLGKKDKLTPSTMIRFGTHHCPLATAMSRSRNQVCFLAYLEGCYQRYGEFNETHIIALIFPVACQLDIVSWRRFAATMRTFDTETELLELEVRAMMTKLLFQTQNRNQYQPTDMGHG